MDKLWSVIFSFVSSSLGYFIAKIMVGLGVSLVTYTAVDAGIDAIANEIRSTFLQGDSFIISILGMAGLGTAVNIILTGYVVSFSIKTVGGALSKFRLNGPTGS